MKCPNCGFNNPDQFKFCGECGSRLAGQVTYGTPPKFSTTGKQQSPHFDAERRQITVMFCDLVGSTRLSEVLDPEDFRRLLYVYQDTCVYAVDQFEGYIAQYLGDGVLIYFGFPKAHEDDAQRAVRCGLEILSELYKLNTLQTQYEDITLSVRIGIHTGLVIVDEIGRDSLALGNTPNIAARIQNLADPDSILISEATHRLVENLFNCQSMDSFALKGVTRKMNVFKVVNEKDIPYSFKTESAPGTTPFVGRENEVRKLFTTWEEVTRGNGKIALIIGEPGIGKSRLLRVFEEQIKDEPHTWLVCRCISYYQNSAFYPVINLLNGLLKYDPKESDTSKLEKLSAALSNYDFEINEALPVMAALLSIPLSAPYHRLKISPQKQKELTLKVLISWLIQTARRKPLLFVIEDVHWADASTLEHLNLLIEAIQNIPILIILTFHPRFPAPVLDDRYTMVITLSRLSREQMENMVKEVSGGRILPPEVIDLILAKTDGVPLFVEELTKMLLESGLLVEEDHTYKLIRSLPKTTIPDTLQDTMMARLDNLGAVKEVVQYAAIIGREFSYDLIKKLIPLSEDVLKRELDNLVEADILELLDDQQHIRYSFKQVLIHDAAYNSLLKSTRQEQHGRIARLLQTNFVDFAARHPDILAHHFSEAGQYDQAVQYHLKSGKLLLEKSAHKEAIGQLRKGLQLINHLQDEKQRDQLELDLHIILGIVLVATKGYGAAEVGRVYDRAKELSMKSGDIPRLFPSMVGQYRFYLLRGDITKALDISELLLSWAQTSGNPELLLEAKRSVGATLFHLGEPSTSLKYLTEAVGIYDPKQHAEHAHLYGTDPAVTCLSYAALAQCLLGFPDQAMATGKRSIQMARSLQHPISLAFTLNHHSWLCQFLKKPKEVGESALELCKISAEYGFPFWQTTGIIFRSWGIAQSEKHADGIHELQEGIQAFRATGAGSVLPYFMALVAEIYLEHLQLDPALTWLEKAEASAQINNEHFFDAEIHRLKGETMYAKNRKNKKNAESLIRQSLETARRQKAKILELRALMSLVVISGDKKEPLEMLTETYNWFSEGLATHDLRQAQTLLKKTTHP